MVWIVPSHSIGKLRFHYLLLNRRVPTHQNPIFDIEKHPILPKLGTFNNNLLSVHPVYVIWALSLLMKTHRSLCQILQKGTPKGKHVYIYQYINLRPLSRAGLQQNIKLMTHCRSSSQVLMIFNLHEEFRKHTHLDITYLYSYYFTGWQLFNETRINILMTRRVISNLLIKAKLPLKLDDTATDDYTDHVLQQSQVEITSVCFP